MTNDEMCHLARVMPRAATERAVCAGEGAVRRWPDPLTDGQKRALQSVTIQISLIADGAVRWLPRIRRAPV
jgi:hypothetical protein